MSNISVQKLSTAKSTILFLSVFFGLFAALSLMSAKFASYLSVGLQVAFFIGLFTFFIVSVVRWIVQKLTATR